MGGSLGVVVCWVVLVALSVGTVLTGASGLWGVVLGLAVVKGWVIVDGFMELRHGPWGWRLAMVGWGVVIVGGILVAVVMSTWAG